MGSKQFYLHRNYNSMLLILSHDPNWIIHSYHFVFHKFTSIDAGCFGRVRVDIVVLYGKVEPSLVEMTKVWPSHLVASQQTNCNLREP